MNPRPSSEKRRVAILDAVRRVFAEKGFHGTTTKDLAHAAGVSEALIFKHFPTKEILYQEMLDLICASRSDEMEIVPEGPPSTEILVQTVQAFTRILSHNAHSKLRRAERRIHHRLMLQSLLSDGGFARAFTTMLGLNPVERLAQCLQAASEAGACDDRPATIDEARMRAWSTLHLLLMTMLYDLPDQPSIDYRISRPHVVTSMTSFCLRGLGLKASVIERLCSSSSSISSISGRTPMAKGGSL